MGAGKRQHLYSNWSQSVCAQTHGRAYILAVDKAMVVTSSVCGTWPGFLMILKEAFSRSRTLGY